MVGGEEGGRGNGVTTGGGNRVTTGGKDGSQLSASRWGNILSFFLRSRER